LTVLVLLLSFALLLGGALVFTNAVEWAGVRLDLGHGAVGSILAAVATAMPESLIPVVALIGGAEESEQVAIGAIIGAPFLLATLAMALIGISAFGFRERRDQRERIDVHAATTRRDLVLFLVFLGLALALGLVGSQPAQLAGAVLLVVGYGAYVWRSVVRGGEVGGEGEPSPLYVDPTKRDPPATWQIAGQSAAGIAAIAGGAHLFVHEVTALAESLGVTPLVLALVLAPVATELPEKINSVIWAREGKDALALGNVTGAMVFQTTVPVAVGLAFTRWEIDRYSAAAIGAALAGGALALWAVTKRDRFGLPVIAVWLLLFAGFVSFVAATAG
jgi:cation:H+ antiporter